MQTIDSWREYDDEEAKRQKTNEAAHFKLRNND